jgi:hypothetical protein
MQSRFSFSTDQYTLIYQGRAQEGATTVYLSQLSYANGFQVAVTPPSLGVSQSAVAYASSAVQLGATVLTIPATNGRVVLHITARTDTPTKSL